MAFANITVTNGIEIKKVPLGYSWTTLFFGIFPSLFRGDWFVCFCLTIACVLTGGLASIVFSFVYNKMYAKALFNNGYWINSLPSGTTEDDVKNYVGFVTLLKKK